MTQYALRVPESMFSFARTLAAEEQVSMNQFFVTAIAEKIAALKTETYFKERAARGATDDVSTWLNASPNLPAIAGDEMPQKTQRPS